ncbi:MAG TPA: molybdopterin-dependent oxidoreductase [Anaeromyxobacter sp.]|nr:molybdopterin-dependent oxidoreductase [Anaeromyxobacter sp.]
MGGAAGTGLRALFASAESPIAPPRGPEREVLSVCDLCSGGCGVRVRMVGDRAVRLDGNPLHPVSGGRLCPRGQAALQALYHPDRPPGPLRRSGPRGALASFQRATWDEALDAIAGRLAELRRAGRPEAVVLVTGGGGAGLGPRVARRFLSAYGSPNDVALHRGDEAAAIALALTQGVRAVPALDLASADYVLSLGSALLEASSAPVHATRAFGEFRRGRPGRRGKLVHVEPRLSITAASADEWIAVRPGTEGVFALGVAAAILAEGLHARSFVAERVLGLEEERDAAGRMRPGLRAVLERRYRLEEVEAETGVPGDVILRVAREFSSAGASLAVGPRKGPLLPGRTSDHLAAGVLNALAGVVDAPGGVLVADEPPLPAWPAPPQTVSAAWRERPRLDGAGAAHPLLASDPERLADAIREGAPYRAEALLLLEADPAFASADPDAFAAALDTVPLVVSMGSLPDDTALLADWILPTSHFLERGDLHTTPPGVPYPVVSLARPALPRPVNDARAAAEVFFALARRVAPDLAAALPWRDVDALVRFEVDGLFAARRGAVMGTPFDEAFVRMMERAGWWAPGYRTAEELWTRAHAAGGWWDPFYDHGDFRRVLRTASGRLELRADLLEAAPAAEGAEGTLALLLFEPLPIAGGTGAELPFLQAILDPGHDAHWETWAELHPDTAARLGVAHEDWVRIESPRASIVARARVTSRVVADAVAVPVGLGRKGGGRWASGVGANPLRLVERARDPISGLPDLAATRVRVARVAAPGGRA